MRLDQALTQLQIAPSRSKAQELIRAGKVEVLIRDEWRLVTDVSYSVDNLNNESVRLLDDQILKYVSRGGLKLEGALRHLNLEVRGMRALDVGQSTGGFTHCLLEHGAAHVTGVDVGHGQLHDLLKNNPQVTAFEGVHLRDLPQMQIGPLDICVIDVSFISLRQVFPVLKTFLKPGCQLLALVKPQFELDAKSLNKKGVVKDEQLLHNVRDQIYDLAAECGWIVRDYFPSPIRGQDGNQEFFVHVEIGSHI
jgi:23S rRNA (cytidine1920-2'-O)/16S rRNA (cytidine1409-2'-O)-methyltransferase